MVIWISGKRSSGKTTYGKRLKVFLESLGGKVLLLDGDEIRDLAGDKDFTDEAREKHIMTTARFASLAEKQGFIIIICLVSPKKKWRMEARKLFDRSILIPLPNGELWEGTDYEEVGIEETMFYG